MSRRDDSIFLHHMLSYALEAVAMIQGKERSSLDSNRMLELALVRLVEVIGEAAGRVSEATRQSRTQIPWPQIRGMRNRLIHGYDVVDLDVLWDTVTDDLPSLIRGLEEIVDSQ